MKKFFNSITSLLLAGATLFTVASCKVEDENTIAKAVLGETSVLTFAADSPQGQVVTVVSDAEWHVTAPEWIKVDPETGSGVTEVTVMASNNTDSQGELAPREGELIFGGATKASEYKIIVRQNGDAYRGVTPISIADAVKLSDGTAFIVNNANVAAVTAAGCVLTDGAANIYVKTDVEGVAVGDVVTVKGTKSSVNGMPMVNVADSFVKVSEGSVVYPEPIDLTASIASYAASSIEYVTVTGEVLSGAISLTVDGQEYAVKQVDPTAEQNIADLEGHKVLLTGYSYGKAGAGIVNVLTATMKDKGVATVVYFTDDFEWLEPYSAAAGAGDAVATNDPSTTAPNIYSTADLAPLQKELADRGYDFINSGKNGAAWVPISTKNDKTVYLQRNYLKFGKTSYNTGIVLPALNAIPGTDDILIEFDWAWQVTGAYNADIMTLQIDAANGGVFEESGSETSPELESAQSTEAEKSKIEWQHVAIVLNGANANTVLTIRPTNSNSKVSNPDRDQNRWYIDNIRITPANGGSVSGKTVFKEDFEWLDPYSVAAGAGDSVASNDPSATAPNIYSTADLAPLQAELAARGYDFINSGKNGEAWVPISTKNDKTVYLQKNYLKFGKTSYNTGIVLPALSKLEDTADVVIEFDWCWQVTGSFNPDIMTLQVVAANGGTFETSKSEVSDEIESAQITEPEKSKIEWQHAKVVLNGATANTVLTIRPTNSNSKVSNPERDQNRWYLDNIQIKTL